MGLANNCRHVELLSTEILHAYNADSLFLEMLLPTL